MGADTRLRIGKLYAQGKWRADDLVAQGFYNEFKEQIDAELNPVEEKPKPRKKKED